MKTSDSIVSYAAQELELNPADCLLIGEPYKRQDGVIFAAVGHLVTPPEVIIVVEDEATRTGRMVIHSEAEVTEFSGVKFTSGVLSVLKAYTETPFVDIFNEDSDVLANTVS